MVLGVGIVCSRAAHKLPGDCTPQARSEAPKAFQCSHDPCTFENAQPSALPEAREASAVLMLCRCCLCRRQRQCFPQKVPPPTRGKSFDSGAAKFSDRCCGNRPQNGASAWTQAFRAAGGLCSIDGCNIRRRIDSQGPPSSHPTVPPVVAAGSRAHRSATHRLSPAAPGAEPVPQRTACLTGQGASWWRFNRRLCARGA